MNYTFDGLNKAYYANVSNPKSASLTWETISTYNIGLDLAFLRNRLTVTADYFIRYTKDMLTHSLTLPAVFGAEAQKRIVQTFGQMVGNSMWVGTINLKWQGSPCITMSQQRLATISQQLLGLIILINSYQIIMKG